MKTLYISIIVLLTVASSSSLAYAEQPLLDFYDNSQIVLVGKVISLSQVPSTTNNPSQSPNQTRYDVQVEQYYKNPQDAKLITVYGYAKGIDFSQDPTYDIGDRVFLYVNQENGHYQIQSYSFVLHNDCDARPLIPLSTLPFEPPPISAPAYATPAFDFQSDTGIRSDTFLIGNKIHINFVAENYLPVAKYATLIFSIKTENNTNLVFNDTKQITMSACYNKAIISWDFIPKSPGTYFVNVTMSGSMSLGIHTILFTDPSLASSFNVRENMAGGTIDKAPYSLSPLQQFKSGTLVQDIKCNQNFQLIIKSENGSPACVKPETAKILYERGWSSVLTIPLGTSDLGNSTIELVSIQTVQSPANPGGPQIQLTLKNIGTASITSLDATLHLANDYGFDFQNVTKSHPLAPGNSISNTKILIGGGFTSDDAYNLTISGIANNIPFGNIQNVHIPYAK